MYQFGGVVIGTNSTDHDQTDVQAHHGLHWMKRQTQSEKTG